MKYCAVFALMVIVAACAMGGKKAAMAPSEAQTQQTMPATNESAKSELDRLYAQVEQERQSMQLAEPMVSPGAAMPMTAQPTTATDNTCRPAQSETCTSSCKLSDSICTNAGKICKLANELAPDEDAAAKCVKADKTCKTAHDKCCSCQL
jgi:hypothetical protein